MPPTFHIPNSSFLTPFGARYYQSTHSFWLSVDPLADKYPNLSPYTYCAGNPVRYFDEDGRKVFIVGEQQQSAFDRLSQGTNLCLTINENGQISIVGGNVLNENDQKLLNAINSSDITCNINTGLQYGAGEYNGTIYDVDNGSAQSTNNVNILAMNALEKKGAEGAGMIHEITEGYFLGEYAMKNKQSIPTDASHGYEQEEIIGVGNTAKTIKTWCPINPEFYGIYTTFGHSKATTAPNELTRKQSKAYKCLTVQ